MTKFNKDGKGEQSDPGKKIVWIKSCKFKKRMSPLKNCIQFNNIDAKSGVH